MKNCRSCNLNKEDSEFRIYKGKTLARCRSCENKYLREYRAGERRANVLQNRKIYNLKYSKSKKKDGNLRRKFNISIEIYNKLLNLQNNVCYICNNPESILNKSLAVDHCHTTGKIRGLLCSRCNKALGLFNDNIELLNKAIYYLKLNQLNKTDE